MVLSIANYIKLYNKLIININLGILNYYKVYFDKVGVMNFYLKDKYTNYKIRNFYNKASKNLVKSYLGRYINYFINYHSNKLDLFTNEE